jgi:hypothetical protein
MEAAVEQRTERTRIEVAPAHIHSSVRLNRVHVISSPKRNENSEAILQFCKMIPALAQLLTPY